MREKSTIILLIASTILRSPIKTTSQAILFGKRLDYTELYISKSSSKNIVFREIYQTKC